MTELSIVIPSYDSSVRLRESLSALKDQAELQSAGVEVIVVDDGSSDDTERVIRTFGRSFSRFRSIFRPRDTKSCRARARNLGLQAAVGRTLLFLDAGVLPTPALLRRAIEQPVDGSSEGVIYKTLGLFTDIGRLHTVPDASHLLSVVDRLAASATWEDVRQPFVDSGGNAGMRLPAPWLLAWTCALSVPRQAALSVGGFDEEFIGWGAEDIDFAGRLAALGLRFAWGGNDAVAVHLPHTCKDDRQSDHSRNARRVHTKLCTRESELFASFQDGITTNVFASRLDQLHLHQLTPRTAWSIDALPEHRRGRLLCSGLHPSPDLARLAPTAALAHEACLQSELAALWPNARVHGLVGLHLPYSDHSFDDVLIGDFARLLPDSIRLLYLREMSRVGRRVSMILSTSKSYQRRYRQAAGWGWCSVDSLSAIARDSGLQPLERRALDAETMLLSFARQVRRDENGLSPVALRAEARKGA